MKYMLQVIGFADADADADAEFDEGEGPTTEEFVRWQRSLLEAGIHVDGGFLDDYRLATSVQLGRKGERVVTNGPFPETREYLGGWDGIDVADLDLAEEAAQDAIETALARWPVDGVPPAPLAWLLTVARRKAVDRIRRTRPTRAGWR